MCGAGEQLQAAFGRTPKLLRPPYGAVNDDVRLAAKACGVKALVTWTYDFTTWSQTPPVPQRRRPSSSGNGNVIGLTRPG